MPVQGTIQELTHMDFITSTRNAGLTSAHVPDPVFFDPEGHLSIECDQPSAHRLIAYYAYRVAQSPRCLIDHVRLILLLRLHGTSAELSQALIHLFDVLGDAGRELRVSLFMQCRDALDDEAAGRLEKYLNRSGEDLSHAANFIEQVG